jgi:hypothetical protein
MQLTFKWTCLILALLIRPVSVLSQAAPAKKPTIELTRVDLFAQHGWKSTDVSILGVQLGMTRDQAKKIISGKGLILKCFLPNGNGNEIPDGPACEAFFPPSTDTTVGFAFDDAGKVRELGIDQLATAMVWNNHQVSRKGLHGYTSSLVNHYTEALREQLLGSPDVNEQKQNWPSEAEFHYVYKKIGVELRGNRQSSTKYGAQEFLWELNFVPPEP